MHDYQRLFLAILCQKCAPLLTLSTRFASSVPATCCCQVHDYQRLYLSMACYNVSRRPALECDRHAIKIMRFYEPGDLTLANFVAAASPGPNKRCLVSAALVGCSQECGLVFHSGQFPVAASPGPNKRRLMSKSPRWSRSRKWAGAQPSWGGCLRWAAQVVPDE